jgi:ABC-type antimicrobial peptide transport system permease subunit
MIDTKFFLVGFFLGYIFGAILFYLISDKIYGRGDNDGTICSLKELNAFEDFKGTFILIAAIIWPITWFFIVGGCFGEIIYRNKIIKDNEEIRLASWFV